MMACLSATSSQDVPQRSSSTKEDDDGKDENNESMMLGKKIFTFLRDLSSPALQIILNEIYDEDYAFFTWPSAPVLGQFIFFREDLFRDKTILEMGCGTALPGITAVKMKCRRLYLADKFSNESSRQLVERNLNQNDISFIWWSQDNPVGISKDCLHQVVLTRLTWGSFFEADSPLMTLNSDFNPELDCIIASDCFYDEADFESILCTVNFLLRFKCKPKAYFLTTYQERHSDWNIKCQLKRWCLTGESIPLADFEGESSNLLGTSLPGNHTIWLFKISA